MSLLCSKVPKVSYLRVITNATPSPPSPLTSSPTAAPALLWFSRTQPFPTPLRPPLRRAFTDSRTWQPSGLSPARLLCGFVLLQRTERHRDVCLFACCGLHASCCSPGTVAPTRGEFCASWNIFGCHNFKGRMLLASSGERPAVPVNITHTQGRPEQKMSQSRCPQAEAKTPCPRAQRKAWHIVGSQDLLNKWLKES